MTDLPSFFNRSDFLGKYLAGYILVVSYILLFKIEILTDDSGKIDASLFSSLVFIVAGPAFGYAITNLHRSLPYIRNMILGTNLDNTVRRYAKLRTLLSEGDKSELDMAEAEYDFNFSAGIVFIVLTLLTIYNVISRNVQFNEFYFIVFIILAVCLFINAYFQLTKSFRPLLYALLVKYNVR